MTQSYSFCPLRYRHDPSSGEAINVGVLIYAPDASWVRLRVERRTRAFSSLFRGFDRDEFGSFLTRLERGVEGFQEALLQEQGRLFTLEKRPQNAGELAKWLLPDNNGSFQFGLPRAGITDDMLKLSDTVFERLIGSRRPELHERKRRDEGAVWSVFQNAFREQGIARALSRHVVQTPVFELPFEHAFQNERWHAIEPLSFDYARPEDIRDTAMLWYSYGAALSESDDFAKLYLLLGPPVDSSHLPAYHKARRWLDKMPISHQIIEESQAEEFAADLAAEMKSHGVLIDEADDLNETTPVLL